MIYTAFEGIDGSGKSTQYTLGVKHLKETYGNEAIEEYKYSDKNNPFGRLIKKIYNENPKNKFSFLTKPRAVQEFIYALNARQNCRRINNSGEILISDRSVVTSYASHKDLVPEWFLNLAEPYLYPDLAIFLDVAPEVCFNRISSSDRDFSQFEENLDSMRLFHENYLKIFNKDRPSRLKNMQVSIVDGNRTIEEVSEEISHILDSWILENYSVNGGMLNGKKN